MARAWRRAIALVGSLSAAAAVLGCGDETTAPIPPVTVTAVSPASGPLGGGTNVTITGTNFVDVTGVTIGGSELGDRTVVTATEITGTTPAATSAGTRDVVVTSSSREPGTCSGCFTYNPTLVLSTTSLPNATATVPYSETLVATGGDSTYTWSVTVGSLPTGLSLTTSTGLISGTPSVVGSQTFTVQVASGDGQTDTRQLTITVEPPVLQPSELCSDYPDYAIATFEDTNLEAAIRTALSVGGQEHLTCGLISGLTALDASYAEITSLVGIQNLTSLTDLLLRGNSISDISALSGLTSLRRLSLGGNSISDIGALSGLTSLTYLLLGGNSISDISALSGLTSLEILHLGVNSISDISALSGLTSLRGLYFDYNSISDISALSGLTSLTWLVLDHNSISDISALSGLTSLTWLELDSNSISDISALSGLTSLTDLFLGSNSISDISPLSGLTSARSLGLANNSISDISGLSGLTSLTYLNLGYNSISDISALGGLTSLTDLRLNNNPNLTDIQPLLNNAGLGAGDTVELQGTSVSCSDVAALEAKGVTVLSDCP